MARISNRPLPDGHPFKGGCIIFGANIPEAWKERLRKKMQGPPPAQPRALEEEQLPPMREPDDLEAQAFDDYEDSQARMIYKKAEKEQ